MSGATLVCASFAITLIWGQSLGLAAVYCLLAGFLGILYALYPLALAHANDRVGTPTDTADIGAGLLLCYGIGAAASPLRWGQNRVSWWPRQLWLSPASTSCRMFTAMPGSPSLIRALTPTSLPQPRKCLNWSRGRSPIPCLKTT